MGADRRMVLVEPEGVPALLAATEARVGAAFPGAAVGVLRQEVGGRAPAHPGPRFVPSRRTWAGRRDWAEDASLVLGEAFGVEPGRRLALENDVLACISRPGCSMLLVDVDGEPAAVARRAWTPDGSYLSSIGTRPSFRGRGLGAFATLLAVRDALESPGAIVHLAVDVDNDAAVRMYEGLGFRLVGDAAPDLLLH
jgi:ribosomal protein S18 acetylase RimI-like enzyme